MLVKYHSKSGTDYSFNSEGWKRNDEILKYASYIPIKAAVAVLQAIKRGVGIDKLIEACNKIKLDKSRGVVFYETLNGELKISGEITSRTPHFKSLDNDILDWLDEATPVEEKRDRIQIEQENKDEEKGKDDSTGTIGFKD